MGRFVTTFGRVFDPEVLERAFGPRGEPGDAHLIERVAGGVVQVYESMLDWAAELRNTTVPSDWVELVELVARMADGPVRQIREFIQLVAAQIAQIPLLMEQARNAGATVESPKVLELTMELELDPANQEKLYAELDRLRES
jgi:hypothetical protein